MLEYKTKTCNENIHSCRGWRDKNTKTQKNHSKRAIFIKLPLHIDFDRTFNYIKQ